MNLADEALKEHTGGLLDRRGEFAGVEMIGGP